MLIFLSTKSNPIRFLALTYLFRRKVVTSEVNKSLRSSLVNEALKNFDLLSGLVLQLVVRCFEDERDVVEVGTVHDAAEPLDADLSLANVLMAI